MLESLKGEVVSGTARTGIGTSPSGRWPLPVPAYLEKVYWWAYVRPQAVAFWERQWLVNLILFGNFKRLRDWALDELGKTISGRTLQIACVYGDLSAKIANRVADGGLVDVVDIAPAQLDNLRRKIPASAPVHIFQRDSTALRFADAAYDQVMLFFLLHEQPESVRRQTLNEALRVLRPCGKLVIVDYHRPSRVQPIRYFLYFILRWLEPFALDLWRHDLTTWMPEGFAPVQMQKETCFGGVYQKIVLRV